MQRLVTTLPTPIVSESSSFCSVRGQAKAEAFAYALRRYDSRRQRYYL